MYFAKDFIETREGLLFAVVASGTEQGRVLGFLRYVRQGDIWCKFSTEQANALLESDYPQYRYYSATKDVMLHAVPEVDIFQHHRPRHRLQILMRKVADDGVERDTLELCRLFLQHRFDLQLMGVTGSLLPGVQNDTSDIDLVIYAREHFMRARRLIELLINRGQLRELADADWLSCYQRRLCTLSFQEYVWHERRKFNKALINGRKFDISLVNENLITSHASYRKCGKITLQAKIIDATGAFDYPAEFRIDHERVKYCVSYTATYTGQAKVGERVEVSGLLEQSEQGERRIVIGSNREAAGEYIKVIA